MNTDNILMWAKVKSDGIIPSRKSGDAGYDIYACFDNPFMAIKPHTTAMIPTGIASAFDSGYVMFLKERGSTGTKGIAQRSGVIDASFRGEWQVPITNTTDKLLLISKISMDEYFDYLSENGIRTNYAEDEIILYPYTKAISQAVMLPIAEDNSNEISYEELQAIPSHRGSGMLGSSGK